MDRLAFEWGFPLFEVEGRAMVSEGSRGERTTVS